MRAENSAHRKACAMIICRKSVRTEIDMFFYAKLVTVSKFIVKYIIIAQNKPNKHARLLQVSDNLTKNHVRADITLFR